MFFEREFYYVPEILDVFYHMNAIGLTYISKCRGFDRPLMLVLY